MPLVTMNELLLPARKGRYAVGAFTIWNTDFIRAVLDAAEELKSPVIVMFGMVEAIHNDPHGLANLAATCREMLGRSPVPVALHLDHAMTIDPVKEALANGFTSVMYDGSAETFDKNIENTKKIVECAHAHKPFVTVEAELGKLGGIEEDVVGVGHDDVEKFLTDPKQVEEFVKRSGCDSLAVAIGTSHGAYKFKHAPKLAFDRIEEIGRRLPGFPLVMHGSSAVPKEFIDFINSYAVLQSKNKKMLEVALKDGWEQMPGSMGVPDEAISRASKMAVCKVNIDTDLRLGMTASILKVWGDCNAALLKWIEGGKQGSRPKFNFDPREYLGPAREAIRDVVAGKLDVLGVSGKAGLFK